MLDAKLVGNLIKTLQYENHTYAGLLNLAEEKTEYLVKNDTVSVSKITADENKMVEQAGQLGKVREQCVLKICEELCFDKINTIDEIRKSLPKGQGDTLGGMREKLRETVLKLVVRNGINQKLIENALKYINFNLELMASPAPETPVYGKSGQELPAGRKRSLLDIKY